MRIIITILSLSFFSNLYANQTPEGSEVVIKEYDLSSCYVKLPVIKEAFQYRRYSENGMIRDVEYKYWYKQVIKKLVIVSNSEGSILEKEFEVTEKNYKTIYKAGPWPQDQLSDVEKMVLDAVKEYDAIWIDSFLCETSENN